VAADESLCADVDVNGWTEYDFVGTSDTSFRVSLLRPSSWGAQLALGAQLFMTMSEFNVSDWVQLVHVEAGAVDAGGAGCPVITTFARTAHDVIELNIAGDDAPMHVTSGHKFYSATRHDWVRAKMLQVGEELVTHEGTTTVEGIDLRARAAATVFNVEVAGAHTYFVGAGHELVHNQYNGNGNAAEGMMAAGQGNRVAGVQGEGGAAIDHLNQYLAQHLPDAPNYKLEIFRNMADSVADAAGWTNTHASESVSVQAAAALFAARYDHTVTAYGTSDYLGGGFGYGGGWAVTSGLGSSQGTGLSQGWTGKFGFELPLLTGPDMVPGPYSFSAEIGWNQGTGLNVSGGVGPGMGLTGGLTFGYTWPHPAIDPPR
jgi:hypothetical protein